MTAPLIAVDPEQLASLHAKIDAVLARLAQVEMTATPEWLPLTAYAAKVGRSTKTVRNWIRAGQLDTRREGAVTLVRAR